MQPGTAKTVKEMGPAAATRRAFSYQAVVRITRVMDPITALPKAVGTMTVPPLSEGVKSAVVLNWNRGWRDKVNAGDVLVVLKTANGNVEIRAPISG